MKILKKNESKIYSIISLNWRDIQSMLLYESMTESYPEYKEHKEADKERKLFLIVDFLVKVK
jgi:hypothetical protein